MPDAGETDLQLAARAASGAAEIALKAFHAGSGWWEKSPNNPVSHADLECDAWLKSTLMGARPGDGWLSEETADTEARLALKRLWVVDPIDGTRDFVRGRTGWAVSVALVEDGQPVVAALAAPARGQLFLAERGKGATLNGAPLKVSGLASLPGIRLPIDAVNIAASFWPSPWPGTAVDKPNSLALRMAMLAEDTADAWLEGRTVSEWDVAASALIVTEAGGVVTDRTGAPLAFNKPAPVIHGIAASTPALHAEVLARLDHALRLFAARRRGEAAAG